MVKRPPHCRVWAINRIDYKWQTRSRSRISLGQEPPSNRKLSPDSVELCDLIANIHAGIVGSGISLYIGGKRPRDYSQRNSGYYWCGRCRSFRSSDWLRRQRLAPQLRIIRPRTPQLLLPPVSRRQETGARRRRRFSENPPHNPPIQMCPRVSPAVTELEDRPLWSESRTPRSGFATDQLVRFLLTRRSGVRSRGLVLIITHE